MNGKYDDIINLKYVKSERHSHMSKDKRAAQFSPFAALKGFDESIEKTQAEFNDSFEDYSSFSDSF